MKGSEDLLIFGCFLGSGKLNWIVQEENKPRMTALRRGDVYRLKPGTVFYLRSNLEAEREKLRIYAIFIDSEDVDLDVGIFLLFFVFFWVICFLDSL